MSSPISPYALLCASKPKPAPTLVTAYDLYSAAQSSFAPASNGNVSDEILNVPSRSTVPPRSDQPSAAPLTPPSAKRTHYIAEIQSRHNAARRSSVTLHP